ncbi:putative lipid II flippase FtsW [Paenibacillus sp. N1-5-1-14]|uniref:putative lipid II flippase FtsW n=1 Tax=Paenibacillus radicibacter TaxID=2972488 RepID=UPI002159B587|nr:putative lipid II flippase FtsW [Paenibacillus radicibacter]MCR8641745.1 putative lipid II flippase FtsW [Paenibacillus radicibacter]
MNPPRKGTPDFLFLFLTFVLVCFGLVMIFSSSSIITTIRFNDPWMFTKKQLIFALIGIVAMFICMNIPLDKLKKLVLPVFIVILGMLAIMPLIADNVNGARSWIEIAGFSIQPTEFAKVGIILYLAMLISNKDEQFRTFHKGLKPALIVVGLVSFLIMLQPDLGSTLVLILCAATVIFAGGAKMKHLFAVGTVLMVVASFATIYMFMKADTGSNYRVDRFLAFMDPEKYENDASYQITKSLYAFGHGGITGTGYGQGIQKLHYLPEAHNDFIFSTIGEEFGLIGSLLLIAVYIVLIWRGLILSVRCKDKFGMLAGVGIIGMIGFQTLINIGGVTSSIPLTGVTLPLISAGGSSLIVTLAGLGIVLGVSRSHNQIDT